MHFSSIEHTRGPVTLGDWLRFTVVALYLLLVLGYLLLRRQLRLPVSFRRFFFKWCLSRRGAAA